jgi:hypothetical protein
MEQNRRARVDPAQDRRCPDRSMNFRSALIISSLGAASAALCFALALAVPAGSLRLKPDSGLDPGISDTVNRASKGDRMRVIVRPPDSAPFEVQMPGSPSPKPTDGCESAFGWRMDQSSPARPAQRCVT